MPITTIACSVRRAILLLFMSLTAERRFSETVLSLGVVMPSSRSSDFDNTEVWTLLTSLLRFGVEGSVEVILVLADKAVSSISVSVVRGSVALAFCMSDQAGTSGGPETVRYDL